MQIQIVLTGVPALPENVFVAFESYLRDRMLIFVGRMGISSTNLFCTIEYTNRPKKDVKSGFVVTGEFSFIDVFSRTTSTIDLRTEAIPVFEEALRKHFPRAIGVCLVSCKRTLTPASSAK